jgi:hypothetical protein
MTSVQIITDHVREEANKWRRLSGDTFLNHFKTLTLGAVIEWEQIQGALNRMADEFDQADAIAVENIEAVWTERTTSDGTLAVNPDASADDGRRPAVKRPISNMAGATAKWAAPALGSWEGATEAATVVDLPFAHRRPRGRGGRVRRVLGQQPHRHRQPDHRAGERSRQVVDSLVDERKFTNGLWPQSVTPPQPQATLSG